MIRYRLALFAAAIFTASAILPTNFARAQNSSDRQSNVVNTVVAQALYAASATQAAAERQADQRSAAQRQRILQLDTNLRTARRLVESNAAEAEAARSEANRLAAQLTEAQQNYVADLEERDEAYARQIQLFRTAVIDVSTTPEGLEALRRFNEGDWPGARAILDQLRAAVDQVEDIQRAERYRRDAQFFYEAYGRGLETLDTVIEKYEEVVELDPGVESDWGRLVSLYSTAGRIDDSIAALQQASELGADSGAAALAAMIPVDAVRARDEEAFANDSMNRLEAARTRFQDDPENVAVLVSLVTGLYARAFMQLGAGNVDDAGALSGELIPLFAEYQDTLFALEGPLNFGAIQSGMFEIAARASLAGGRNDEAMEHIATCVELRRQALLEDPDILEQQRQLAIALELQAQIAWELDRPELSVSAFAEMAPLAHAFTPADRVSLPQQLSLIEKFRAISTLAIRLNEVDTAIALADASLLLARAAVERAPSELGAQQMFVQALLHKARFDHDSSLPQPILDEARAYTAQLAAENSDSPPHRVLEWTVIGNFAELSYGDVTWGDLITEIERGRSEGIESPVMNDMLAFARENIAQSTAE